jgi:3-dehydroquinate synthase
LYGDTLSNTLAEHGCSYHFIEVAQGEQAKTIEVASRVIDRILEIGGQRRGLILAFGGGAITDLAGFVASVYMRGINYVNIPTTLVAQLDAAIGGKTSVNHASAKNLIGAFSQPQSVHCDPEVLRTLPRIEVINGLAEAIKVAMISSPELFEFIEANLNNIINQDVSFLTQLVRAAIRLKVELLRKDPYEMDLRRSLNFGHSIAHAIEASKEYTGTKHGEAVAIGMASAARIGQRRGLCSEHTTNRLFEILRRAGLPIHDSNLSVESIVRYMEPIRLIRGGSLHFVLPTEMGKVQIRDDISYEEIAWAITTQ